MTDTAIVSEINKSFRSWETGSKNDSALLDSIQNSQFVLLGEASHGTHEFYKERSEITKKLIEAKKFSAVAVEADWPDAYLVNRFVMGESDSKTAEEALSGFKRFPTWMWRNTEVVEFIDWLKNYNAALSHPEERVGFYGLDLYSLYTSMGVVIDFLSEVDPDAADRAKQRYGCFDQFAENTQSYGYSASYGLSPSCEQEVVSQLTELQKSSIKNVARSDDEFFCVEQNSRLVKNAEAYYRTMFRGKISSWNLRDSHMVETLYALTEHLRHRRPHPKIAVWAHNSHLGDARATDFALKKEWNVGQLVREREGGNAFLIGFTTYHGTVTAASDWDGVAERKGLRPALPGSIESLFHEVEAECFMLDFRRSTRARRALQEPRLERAVGVLYLPKTERSSHYFYARVPEQFDTVIHLDETQALQPLETTTVWDHGEWPETYPTAL